METSGVKKIGDIVSGMVLEEREFECPKHGTFKGFPVKIPRSDHTLDPICPKCEEEDIAERAIKEHREKEEGQKAIEAENEQWRVRWLTGLNIGKRLWGESFETFNAYTEELQHHLHVCIDFADNHQGRKLVMLGNNGTGKNHLAASILKKTGGVIHTVHEINLMLRQSYSRGKTNEYEVTTRLCTANVLVIDEVGRTKGGQWEENWLSYVINKRHENLMPTILISNKHLKEDCPAGPDGCYDCLQKWVGNDILSRIIEDGLIMEFTGDDYRLKIRKSRGVGVQE